MSTVIMMWVQGLLGAARPHLGTPLRPIWRRLHQAWGWLTIAMGEQHRKQWTSTDDAQFLLSACCVCRAAAATLFSMAYLSCHPIYHVHALRM